MNTSSLFHNPALNLIKEVYPIAEVCYGTYGTASGGAAIDIPYCI